MKAIRGLIQLLGMIFLIGVTFWWGWRCSRLALKYPKPFTPKIHSPAESQQELKDAGYYNGPIDGKWGPLSDKAYCNYMANRLWPKNERNPNGNKESQIKAAGS